MEDGWFIQRLILAGEQHYPCLKSNVNFIPQTG